MIKSEYNSILSFYSETRNAFTFLPAGYYTQAPPGRMLCQRLLAAHNDSILQTIEIEHERTAAPCLF